MPPPGGVLVSFKLEGTGDLLWRASMNSVPSADDIVSYAEVGGVLVDYKVESVRWEFWKPKPVGEGPTTNCQHTPVVVVSLV